jgi:hypothetical protein
VRKGQRLHRRDWPLTTTPANQQSASFADCPSPSLPIGGGVFAQSGSVGVNVNTTNANGSQWESFISNTTALDVQEDTIAICAGAVV